MKILHTGDWHLGDKWHGIDRAADLTARLEQIAGFLQTHDVDVMLVAGDVFHDGLSREAVEKATRVITDTFNPFLAGGGTILAVSGNHDSRDYFNLLDNALHLAPPPGRSKRRKLRRTGPDVFLLLLRYDHASRS